MTKGEIIMGLLGLVVGIVIGIILCLQIAKYALKMGTPYNFDEDEED